MSAIFGILNFNQNPINPDDIIKMQDAMSYWGPDGKYLWNEDSIGLGQLQLYNTPESLSEKFPLFDNERGLVFVSALRIDNRDELFHLLGIPSELRTSITDAELAFNAFKKYGKDCINYLLGDWMFAVWNSNKKELFIARDHHGISGVYYYHCDKFLIFSSSLKGLLALPQVPKKINELRIAQVLVSWPGDGIQTAYLDILRLPPSHTLSVTESKVEKNRYWFAENTKPLNYKNNNDYIDHFKELFTESVRCRLRSNGKVGSTLSSGLDSSSVSAVAANLLKEKGIRLPVFTSIPLYDVQDQISPNRLANEGPLSAKLVEFNGNMDHFLLKAENSSVLEGIEKMLYIHDQPFHAAANAYWIIDMMENVRKQGCNVLLTGQFGNGTISWPTAQYTNRLLAPKCPKITIENITHYKLFRKNILKPIIPSSIFNAYQTIKFGSHPWESHSALSRSFADKINLRKEMKKAGFDSTFSKIKDITSMQLEIIKPGEAIVGQQWLETGTHFGIDVRDPSMDKRIIEFCLATPDRVYIKNNQGRILIREAMKGSVPEEILWTTKRGLQAADVKERILSEKEKWIETVKIFSKNSLAKEILETSKIQSRINILSENKQTNSKIVNVLSRGITVEKWIERFSI
ncbi:MAG: asparagine synthase-related protein [Tenuifilaceae bacterium]